MSTPSELIIKLTKLANNPNEFEANAAARKVCRLLEEAKFNFKLGTVVDPNKKPSVYQPTEAHQRSYRTGPNTRPSGYSNPFDDLFGSSNSWRGFGFENFYREPQPKPKEPEKKPEEYKTYPKEDSRYWDILNDLKNPVKSRSKEKRIIPCSKCGAEIETGFIGHPKTLVCNVCIFEISKGK